jgi:hypothetical protein
VRLERLGKLKNIHSPHHSRNILNRWKNYFSHLMNVFNVSDVRQIEVHTAETLLPGPRRLEVEITIAMKKYTRTSPGSDEIPKN